VVERIPAVTLLAAQGERFRAIVQGLARGAKEPKVHLRRGLVYVHLPREASSHPRHVSPYNVWASPHCVHVELGTAARLPKVQREHGVMLAVENFIAQLYDQLAMLIASRLSAWIGDGTAVVKVA
jgi:hypothetical protein